MKRNAKNNVSKRRWTNVNKWKVKKARKKA